jgi:predicted nuclease of predicted toxin-antitoxin system
VIIADENIEAEIVVRLRAEGLAIDFILESRKGWEDEEILALASDQGALLLTSDKDFGGLVYHKLHNHAGVVLLRLPDTLTPEQKAELVSEVFRLHASELPGRFTVVTPTSVRIRSTP